MASGNSSRGTDELIAYEENGRLVKLVFDTWTPRPHFIVVQCQSKQDANAAELQATYEIIARFLQINTKFDQQAILSFHRGQWYQQHTGKWHAHLCVPKQSYLEQARSQIKKIPQNKQWQGAKTVEAGIEAWYTRKKAEYSGYKNTCIQNGFSKKSGVENVPLSTFHSNPNEFQLVWTFPDPRIGILANSPTSSTLASLYNFMSKVRSDADKELGKHDKSFSNFGCHLCLYVSGQSGTNVTRRPGHILTEDGRLDNNPNIVGYIQMDASQYVQWLPRQLREVWLNEFRKVEHSVGT